MCNKPVQFCGCGDQDLSAWHSVMADSLSVPLYEYPKLQTILTTVSKATNEVFRLACVTFNFGHSTATKGHTTKYTTIVFQANHNTDIYLTRTAFFLLKTSNSTVGYCDSICDTFLPTYKKCVTMPTHVIFQETFRSIVRLLCYKWLALTNAVC